MLKACCWRFDAGFAAATNWIFLSTTGQYYVATGASTSEGTMTFGQAPRKTVPEEANKNKILIEQEHSH